MKALNIEIFTLLFVSILLLAGPVCSQTQPGVVSSPALANGMVFFGGLDGVFMDSL